MAANVGFLAVNSVVSGRATRLSSSFTVFLVATPVAALVCLIAALGIQSDVRPSVMAVLLGGAAGLVGGLGVPLSYRSFAIGPIGATSATIACTTTIAISCVGIGEGERLDPHRIVGLVVCLVAVIVVTTSASPVQPVANRFAGPLLGLAAGICFSAFALVMRHTPAGEELWALLAARFGVCVVLLVWLLVRWRSADTRVGAALQRPVSRVVLALAALAGATEILANMLLVAALREGPLVTVAIFGALVPAAGAVVSFVLLREKLNLLTALGVVLSVTGALLSVA